MSYGWLTESSIIPTPGNKIVASSSSINSLTTVISQDQIVVDKRKADTSSSRHKPTKKLKIGIERDLGAKNEGVEGRNSRDKQHFSFGQKTLSNSEKKLIEKAKLYEKLVEKATQGFSVEEFELPTAFGPAPRTGKEPATTAGNSGLLNLIDFSRKKHLPQDGSSGSSADKPTKTSEDEEEGRTAKPTEDILVKESSAKVDQPKDESLEEDEDESRRRYLIELSKQTDVMRKEVGEAKTQRRENLRSRLQQLRELKRSQEPSLPPSKD